MRIGIYTHNYPKSEGDRADAGVFVSDFVEELSKKHEVFIFYTGPESGKFGNWKFTNPFSYIKFVWLFVEKTIKSVNFVRKNKLDYILAFWSLPSGVLAYFTKFILGTPYAVWCLGSDLNFYARVPILRILIRCSLRSANFRFANSRKLCKIGGRLSGRSFYFLSAVTENPSAFLKKVRMFANCTNFLFVGRLEKVKGVDVLIKAARILSEDKVKFKINILGDGTMRHTLEKLVRRSGLDDYINFSGQSDKETVFSYMKSSDFLVVPSRSESLPLVIIEAAKVGLPIVATNVGDCGRLMRRYNIGKSVAPNNPKRLAKVLKETVREKKDKYRAGLRLLADDFSLEKSVSMFLKYIV